MWSFRVRIAIYFKVFTSRTPQLSILLCADVLQNTQVDLPYYKAISCWDGSWQAGFFLSVLKTLFLFGQGKISLKNSVTGEVIGMKAIWFHSSIIYPAYQVKQPSKPVYINKKTSPICEIQFLARQSSARVSKRYTSCDYVRIWSSIA